MKMIFAWKRDKQKEIEAFSDEWNFYKRYLTDDEMEYLLKNSFEKRQTCILQVLIPKQGSCSYLLYFVKGIFRYRRKDSIM